MEYCNGGDLADYLSGMFSKKYIIKIFEYLLKQLYLIYFIFH